MSVQKDIEGGFRTTDHLVLELYYPNGEYAKIKEVIRTAT